MEDIKKKSFLELVQDETSSLPTLANDYDKFMEEYREEVPKVLNQILYRDDRGLKFDNNETEHPEQNGILYSFFSEELNKREPLFYEGYIWSGEENTKFYTKFNLCKAYINTTIIDFLLYEKNILIPSKLTIHSIDNNKYLDDCSSFRKLYIPLYNMSGIDASLAMLNDQINKTQLAEDVNWEKYIYETFVKDESYYRKKIIKLNGENFPEKLDKIDLEIFDLIKEINKSSKIIKKDINKILVNFMNAGIKLDNNDKLIDAVIMHNLSIFARSIMIFSSGTFNNVSGLVLSANKGSSNWNKIKKYSNELLYLDGLLRQISTYEITKQAEIKKQKFEDDYKERVKKYKVLSKIIIAILSSIDNLNSDEIHLITSRIKDIDSLYRKIKATDSHNEGKYIKYYNEGRFDELYFESEKEALIFSNNTLPSSTDKIKKDVITDFCGARIIFQYSHEAKKFFQNSLQQYFNIYEIDDKSINNDKGEYGYSSIHLIMSLKKETVKFFAQGEKDDDKRNEKINELESLVFELQIRTILQHGWAGASHEFYKNREDDNIKGPLSRASHFILEADEILSYLKEK